jgi:hypothetical protein
MQHLSIRRSKHLRPKHLSVREASYSTPSTRVCPTFYTERYEKGCIAHDVLREVSVAQGPTSKQYAFIQSKINRLVIRAHNCVKRLCKRWDTPIHSQQVSSST